MGIYCANKYSNSQSNYAPVDIGSEGVRALTLTRISIDNGQQPRYGDEVAVGQSDMIRSLLGYSWFNREFYVEKGHEIIKPGDCLIAVHPPYRLLWAIKAPFRKGTNKGLDDRPSLNDKVVYSQDSAIKYYENWSYDYFSTSKYIVAAFNNPNKLIDAYGYVKENQPSKEQFYIQYGLCSNVKKLENLLLESSPMRYVLDQIEKVDEESFPKSYNIYKYKSGRKSNEYRPLVREVRYAAESLAKKAIRQALAGPYVKWCKQTRCWKSAIESDCVADSALEIFWDHLTYFNNLRNTLDSIDQPGSCVDEFEKSEVQYLETVQMAWSLATHREEQERDGKLALQLMTLFSRQDDNYLVSMNKAAIHAELGSYEHALEWQKRAIDCAPKDHKARIPMMLKQIEAYRQCRPWRD